MRSRTGTSIKDRPLPIRGGQPHPSAFPRHSMLLPVTLFLGVSHLAVITSCKPLKRWEDLLVKHFWDEIPRGWECRSPAPADYLFDLKFGMKQPRMGELIANLMEISDPEHPRFVFRKKISYSSIFLILATQVCRAP